MTLPKIHIGASLWILALPHSDDVLESCTFFIRTRLGSTFQHGRVDLESLGDPVFRCILRSIRAMK